MNLGELRAEVKSRLNGEGYRFLSDSRTNRFINQARAELDQMYCWPYREASTSGTAPLTIADLGLIEKVFDTSNGSTPLMRYDFSTLVDLYGSLSTGGSPECYYVGWPSGSPVIATYPTSSHTIGVQYWKVTVDLTADGDVPLAPVQFHGLLVDMATQKALRANRIHREADEYEATIQQKIQAMLFALPPGTPDGPDAYVGFTGASEDC